MLCYARIILENILCAIEILDSLKLCHGAVLINMLHNVKTSFEF